MVSNAHENLTAEQRAEIDEIASLCKHIKKLKHQMFRWIRTTSDPNPGLSDLYWKKLEKIRTLERKVRSLDQVVFARKVLGY